VKGSPFDDFDEHFLGRPSAKCTNNSKESASFVGDRPETLTHDGLAIFLDRDA
jgi:hypothetical protein